MCYIKAKNIREAHEEILRRILKPENYKDNEGKIEVKDVWDELGNKTKEVHNILVTIEHPLDEKNMICPIITKAELDIYADCHLDWKKAEEAGFIPGIRISKFLGVSQSRRIKDLLLKTPNSRRASIITCNPQTDWDDDRPPCLLLIDLKIREDELLMTGVLRSNDMYRTWPANAYSLARLLEKFSKELKIKPGHLDILSISAHIYEEDLDKAERALIEHD